MTTGNFIDIEIYTFYSIIFATIIFLFISSVIWGSPPDLEDIQSKNDLKSTDFLARFEYNNILTSVYLSLCILTYYIKESDLYDETNELHDSYRSILNNNV